MIDTLLNRIAQYIAVLVLVVIAVFCAFAGYYGQLCPAGADVAGTALQAVIWGSLFFPPLLLGQWAAAAVVVFVVDPFKTPRRRRWQLVAIVAGVPLFLGGGAVVAKVMPSSEDCRPTSWQ